MGENAWQYMPPGPVAPLRIAGPVLGVLIAVLLAVAFWVGRDLRAAQAAADDRQAAMRVAGAHAVYLLSVSHQSVDADIKRILDTSTGPARAEYVRTAEALKEPRSRAGSSRRARSVPPGWSR